MNSANARKQCAEIHESVVLAVYGELPDDEVHALAMHLEGCPECREEQEQLFALKTLSEANPLPDLDANLVARSRTRLEEALDALPPKRWYDRVAEWMTRTANGLQAAPAAACLLLVAGVGAGSLGGYEFAQRHALSLPTTAAAPVPTVPSANVPAANTASGKIMPGTQITNGVAGPVTTGPIQAGEIAGVSAISQKPNSNLVEVSFNQIEPRQVQGTIDDPEIRQLLMLASQNAASPQVRDNSIGLLAAACRSEHGCQGKSPATSDIRDALMVTLRYDRSAAVRSKALDGLQPYIGEDMRVRNAVLEALLNDPEAQIRSAAISMLEPVEADTSVRQVLSTVALSDENSRIRSASRLVLRRVSELQ
jgi:anti-sigma factor RsiW